jgi:hypothetical protein
MSAKKGNPSICPDDLSRVDGEWAPAVTDRRGVPMDRRRTQFTNIGDLHCMRPSVGTWVRWLNGWLPRSATSECGTSCEI